MFDPYHKWLGIPAKDQPPNHYRLLGIELFETDADVIDAAANKQMAYIQGCATGPHLPLSQKLLNEIAAARLCLLTAAKKADYDAKLRAGLARVAVPLAVPIAVAPPTSAITAASPPPTVAKATGATSSRDTGAFHALTREPDVAVPTPRQRERRKWPILLGCAVLGAGGLVPVILAVFLIGMFRPSKVNDRQAEQPVKKPEQKKPLPVKPAKKDAQAPAEPAPLTRASLAGLWLHSAADGPFHEMRLHANGKINNPDGACFWTLQDRTLLLYWPTAQDPGGYWIDKCTLSADGRSYEGTNQNGISIRGKRISALNAENVVGRFRVTFMGPNNGSADWEFTADHKAIQDGKEKGTWTADGNIVTIVYHEPRFGTAILEFKDANTLTGHNVHANGAVFYWTVVRQGK